MDMLMKILFKFVQFRIEGSIGVTSSLWRGVTIAQFRSSSQNITCFLVFFLHHVDRIFNRSKMCCWNLSAFSFCFNQLFDKREKDQFLFALMSSHGLNHSSY